MLLSAFVGLLNLIILSNIASLISKNQSIIDFTIIFYLISPHIIASSTTILKDNLIVFSFLLLIEIFIPELEFGENTRIKGSVYSNESKIKVDFNKMSVKQIKNAIEIAVKNEDYELAAELRDKLTKKNE